MLHQAENPVILVVEPDRNNVQELKVGTKSEIMDMVAIFQLATGASAQQGEEKITTIMLFEDGVLKIYLAGSETTVYRLQPKLQPVGAVCVVKPSKKKQTARVLRSAGNLNFPQDFQRQRQAGDLDCSGPDILQVFNVRLVNLRLQTSGLYIANTKPGGISMDITNSDTNTVMVAIRVLLGTQDVSRVPMSREACGISNHVTLLRPRCQTVNFGATQDPGGVNMTDSIQGWTKTKGAFGSPEDSEEYSAANPAARNHEAKEASVHPFSLTLMDKDVTTTLETHAALVICDTYQVINIISSTALALDEVTRLLVHGTTETSPLGTMARLRTALALLHNEIMANEGSDQLGSQEGAFDNVKMNFYGEQGQTIRQLNAHMLRRGFICCVSSPGGRRQLIAVANRTQLSVVTAASFVPIGKIRDVTFVHTVFGDMYFLLVSSADHMYFQQLCDESSAPHVSFSETNTIGTTHKYVRATRGLAGGGVSIDIFRQNLSLSLVVCGDVECNPGPGRFV